VKLPVLALGLALVPGCGGDEIFEDYFPPPSPPSVSASPADLSTSTAEVPLELVVRDQGGDADGVERARRTIEAVKAKAFLRTYPELVDVPSTTRTSFSEWGSGGTITVVPTTPLASRWFMVGVTDLPEETTRLIRQNVLLAENGLGARFHPGSAPVVQAITLHQDVDPGSSFGTSASAASDVLATIRLSEGVVMPPDNGPLGTMSVGVDGPACAYEPPVHSTPPEEVEMMSSISFRCPPVLWTERRVRFSISDALVNEAGDTVGVVDPAAASSAEVRVEHPGEVLTDVADDDGFGVLLWRPSSAGE
jgi:hypothetical protein